MRIALINILLYLLVALTAGAIIGCNNKDSSNIGIRIESIECPEALSENPSETTFAFLLDLINEYRTNNGLNNLSLSASLNKTAQWMVEDMAEKDYFSHKDSLGRNPFQRMANLGYDYETWKGENLAAGCATAECCLALWQNSDGHNKNLLNDKYRVVGIGMTYNQKSIYGWYCAAEFGGFADIQE